MPAPSSGLASWSPGKGGYCPAELTVELDAAIPWVGGQLWRKSGCRHVTIDYLSGIGVDFTWLDLVETI